MRIACSVFKVIGTIAAVLAGILAALVLFFGFMIVEVEDTAMLPELQPGEKAVVLRCDTVRVSSPQVGDLVLLKAPYYEIGEKSSLILRRITGICGDSVEVGCDTGIKSDETQRIKKEKILGKVIYHG